MSEQPSVVDRFDSLPNSYYSLVIAAAVFAFAIMLDLFGMPLGAGLAAATALFFAVVGIIWLGFFWIFGKFE